MERDCFKLLLLITLIIEISFTTWISAESGEDTWMDPDAWARDHLISDPSRATIREYCKCSENPHTEQKQTTLEDVASLIYFKKFITMLFNRKKFKYDSTHQIYERSIVFTVQPSQMDDLEQLQDPRDLDNILADIFKNLRIPNIYRDGQQHTTETSNGLKTILLNLFYDMLQLTTTSEMRFLLVVSIIALVAWTFNTRFNVGWLPLIFGGIFIYGYLYTYLECNRELEMNQMLEILNRHEGSENTAKGSKFLNFFKEIFNSNDAQGLEKQKIKQSAKLSLGFCRPDHVFIIYFNDIFIKYLQVLVEQCTVTLTTLNSALGFPYNILSGFLLVCMIGYVTKLTFKYIISPSAWAQFMHRKQLYQSDQSTIKSAINDQADRISGDNLKLLLNAINAAPQRVAVNPKQSSASGVEEVKEAVEPNKEETLPQVDKSIASNPNNMLNEKSLDEKTDVVIEDLLKDS